MERDPEEPTNEQRIKWARAALAGYARATNIRFQDGTDLGDAITDTVADLLHLAHSHGCDVATILERAEMHFQAEVEP